MQSIKCVMKVFDEELDVWWVLFEVEDQFGKLFFRMPINKEDFEVGKSYKVRFMEV